MEELRNGRPAQSSEQKEVKTHSVDYTYSHRSREINHQRVSVREIIEDHYRRGK